MNEQSSSSYQAWRHLHLTAALVSVSFFGVRGIWALQRSPILKQRVVKIARDSIDTIFIGSAIGLAVDTKVAPYPFGSSSPDGYQSAPWLTAKLIGLVSWIVCGSIAMRSSRPAVTISALSGAGLSLAYIYGVARTRDPTLNLLD